MMLHEKDLSTFSQRNDEINKWVVEDNEILDEYEKTIQSDEERGLYIKIKDLLTPYRDARGKLVGLLAEEKYEEAKAAYDELENARIALDEAVEELTKYNVDLAAEKADQNTLDFERQSVFMIGIVVLGIVIAVVLGITIANTVSKPIVKIVGAAEKIAEGDLNINIDIDSKDEVGELAKAFSRMADNTNEVIGNMSIAAEQVASGSRQVSQSSMALSQGATEQASSIEELTASLEEISSQTKQNATNASEANELAEDAKVWIGLDKLRMETDMVGTKAIIVLDGSEHKGEIYFPDTKLSLPINDADYDTHWESAYLPFYYDDDYGIHDGYWDSLGSQSYKGMDCRVLESKVDFEGLKMKIWISKEFKFPVRVEMTGNNDDSFINEYSNIKVGPQPDEMFKIPINN